MVHPGQQISTKACSPAATPSASPHLLHVRPSGANGASRNHTALSMLGFYINRAGKSFPTAGGGRSSRLRSNCANTLGVSSHSCGRFHCRRRNQRQSRELDVNPV